MEDTKKQSQLLLDGTPEERAVVGEVVKAYVDLTKIDVEDRGKIYKKRRDFYEGNHHLYTNVIGLKSKEKAGHILAVFNYTWRMCSRLTQALTNSPMRFKIKPADEASEIESIRAEMEENWVRKILKDNHFYDTIFNRNVAIQIRDGDFAIKCTVQDDVRMGKQIKIEWAENMEKLHVIWDDTTGSNYSAVVYRDKWSVERISREFDGFKATPIIEDQSTSSSGSSPGDEYGVSGSIIGGGKVPTGKTKIPMAWVTDAWGWFKVLDDVTNESVWKICNVVMINDEVKQFVKTDYEYNPWMIGHSFDNPGTPWSIAFIDNLVDPQIELNDRTSEEGDMIRIGANQKYVVTNMPNFDTTSIKTGSGQVIFIEGENADFKPLEVNVNPFPSETYINRSLEHMFALGIPKIALATGAAPYTGKVAAMQYQPVSDLVDALRMKWTPILYSLVQRIQDYTVKFFPETNSFTYSFDENTGQSYPNIREVEFEWDSILPQSQSESIVDASTLFDRDVLPVKRYLERAGYQDPMAVIKELKKEAKDPELSSIKNKFRQFSPGVIQAQIDAQRKMAEAEEANAATMGNVQEITNQLNKPQPTAPANKPILSKDMNDGNRGVPAASGVSSVGQVATQAGNVNQVSQNLRAS